MSGSEFDNFAEKYQDLHAKNITVSGEPPDYFAEYKVRDLYRLSLGDQNLGRQPHLLDFGAGIGASVAFLRLYLPDSRVYCLDSSRNSLRLAKSRFEGEANFIAFDGSRIPFRKASFEVVFAACVLHHVEHDKHASLLRELRRILKPGGVIFIYEHNPYNPLTLRAVATCPLDSNAKLIRPAQMKSRLESAGFGVIFLHYRVFFPHVLRSLRPLEKWLTWLPVGAQYYVLARR